MFFPLAFVVAVSAIKDLFEDLKRRSEDDWENNKKTLKYVNGTFQEVPWHVLYVGDIVKVNMRVAILFNENNKVMNKEFLPADLIILKTSEEKGTAHFCMRHKIKAFF